MGLFQAIVVRHLKDQLQIKNKVLHIVTKTQILKIFCLVTLLRGMIFLQNKKIFRYNLNHLNFFSQ